MSLGLLLLGKATSKETVEKIAQLGPQLDIRISVMEHTAFLPGYDTVVALDAPESGTGTELESEFVVKGVGSRLGQLLEVITGKRLLLEPAILWFWENPDLSRLRVTHGTLSDLHSLLARPEGWGVAKEVERGKYDVNLDAPLLFSLDVQ